MNIVCISGRLTKDPNITQTTGAEPMTIARFTLAVDRRFKKDEADFISCVAFKKTAEFCEQYIKKGTKVMVTGHWQTGSYTSTKTGEKVYTNDCIIESMEFAESKKSETDAPNENDFLNIPAELIETLPFN